MKYKDLPLGTSFADGRHFKVPLGHITGMTYYLSTALWSGTDVPSFLEPIKFCVPEEFFE